MRSLLSMSLIAMLLGCASQGQNAPRKDRPLVVRVAPNGYELVSEDGLSDGARRECSIVAIVGSHIPTMVCVDPEQADNERKATQNDLMISRNCRDFFKCVQGDPRPNFSHK